MTEIQLIASRHSAFYSPLIARIAGGFLEAEGLAGRYRPVDAGTSGAGEVARAEAEFFPDMSVEATAAAVEYYQRLGTWSGGIEIEHDLYESALDVFQHSGMLTTRHPYEKVVVPPPGS